MCCVRGNIVVCACPSLKAADFREFARRAGVTIMCPSDCAVFADNRVAGFFPKEGFDGEITLGNEKLKVKAFPRREDWSSVSAAADMSEYSEKKGNTR